MSVWLPGSLRGGLSLSAALLPVRWAGFALWWLLLLLSMGCRVCRLQYLWSSGLVAQWHVGSSWTRDWTDVPCLARRILNYWNTRDPQDLNNVVRPALLVTLLLQPCCILLDILLTYLFEKLLTKKNFVICGRRRGQQRMRWLDGITDLMDVSWSNSRR